MTDSESIEEPAVDDHQPELLHWVDVTPEGLSFHAERIDPTAMSIKDDKRYSVYEYAVWDLPFGTIREGSWNSLVAPADITKYLACNQRSRLLPSDPRRSLISRVEGDSRCSHPSKVQVNQGTYRHAMTWTEYTGSLVRYITRINITFSLAAHDMSFSVQEARLTLYRAWLLQASLTEPPQRTSIIHHDPFTLRASDGVATSKPTVELAFIPGSGPVAIVKCNLDFDEIGIGRSLESAETLSELHRKLRKTESEIQAQILASTRGHAKQGDGQDFSEELMHIMEGAAKSAELMWENSIGKDSV